MDSDSPFDILGIPPTATRKEIKKAFKYSLHRSKALLCHPDKAKNEASGEAFHRLRAAYELLLNDETRLRYTEQWERKQSRDKASSDTVKRFREDLLAKEAKYRADKAAKLDQTLHKAPRKRRKSPEPSPPRRQSSVIDQDNVIYVQWSYASRVYTKTMLLDLFSPLGPVLDVVTNREKSGAFVVFASGNSAVSSD